jgi:Flp pilus assembly CpaE family ATPase
MAKATPEHGLTDGAEAFGAAPHERPVPRISIHAFCEFPDTGAALQRAAADRRLSKAHVTVQLGGLQAAVEHYTGQVTPNLLIVETRLQGKTAVDEIDRLAEVCDPTTKVVIVGRVNDVELYRELMRRGVSEYLGSLSRRGCRAHRTCSRLHRRTGRRRFVDAGAQCRLVHCRGPSYQYDDRRSGFAVRHGRAQLQ